MIQPDEIGIDTAGWGQQEWDDYANARLLVRAGKLKGAVKRRASALMSDIEQGDAAYAEAVAAKRDADSREAAAEAKRGELETAIKDSTDTAAIAALRADAERLRQEAEAARGTADSLEQALRTRNSA